MIRATIIGIALGLAGAWLVTGGMTQVAYINAMEFENGK